MIANALAATVLPSTSVIAAAGGRVPRRLDRAVVAAEVDQRAAAARYGARHPDQRARCAALRGRAGERPHLVLAGGVVELS